MREVIPWDNDVLTIGGLLKYAADRYQEKTAIRYRSGDGVADVSYRRLFADSCAVRDYLNALVPGRCNVGIVGKTDYRFLTSMNAIFMSGKVLCPMAPDYSLDKLVALLDDADVKVLFYDRTQEQRLPELKEKLPKLEVLIDMSDEALYTEIHNDGDDFPIYEELADPDDCAAIIYTSGTTGSYKGVMLSSRALISNVWFEEMHFEGENVTLNVLPMHHIFCLSCDYLKNLKDGVTICLNIDLQNFYRNLLLFEPTILRLVPSLIESIIKKVRVLRSRRPELSRKEAGQQIFGRRLTNIIASGATLSPELAQKFEEMGITIRQGYGMTETGPRVSVPDGNTVYSSGGRIISICRVRLAPDGEIQVKSPSLLMGYYKKPEETEAVFTEDGWFKTGDIGEITPDNELFIRGRIKNLIILPNGENVSPEEIEKKYADKHLVKEIVVFGEGDHIAAEIFPDMEFAAYKGYIDIEKELHRIVGEINLTMETTREITQIYVRKTPFEKTASGKIIRKQVKIA